MSSTSHAASLNLIIAPVAPTVPVALVVPVAPAVPVTPFAPTPILAPIAVIVPVTLVAPIAPTTVISITMSDSDSGSSSLYCSLLVLSHNNFNDWKIQIIAYLTVVSNHVHVISCCANRAGIIVNPLHPTNSVKVAKWDVSDCMALGVIMSTVSKLHSEIVLCHCEAARPVFKLWEKISSMHQLHDALLCHPAWLEFFSTHKNADKLYLGLASQMEGLWAKIDRLTLAQTEEQS